MNEGKKFVDTRSDLSFRSLADLESEGDVAAHRHVFERCIVLEDEADVALLRRQRRRVFAGDLDRSAVGLLETGDDAQQGRLATATGAEQCGQRTGRDVDGDIVQGDEVAETLDDVVDADAHQLCSSGRRTLITMRVKMATIASVTETVYAVIWSKF